MQQLQIPPLAEGEIYIGAIGDNNGDVYHVILLPGNNNHTTFADALEWAKSIGGDLPTRVEQAMLWGSRKGEFNKNWYWSNESNHFDSNSAWYQSFGYGVQRTSLKTLELRARAVRRVPLGKQS